MEFKGHLIMSLLRILTPEEISRLTTSYSGQKKIPLSVLLAADVNGEKYKDLFKASTNSDETPLDSDKILPFPEKENFNQPTKVGPVAKLTFQCGIKVLKLLEAYSKTFEKMNKNIFGQVRFPKKVSKGSVKQTSSMILEEKKKLYKSYSMIKRMEVLSLYKDGKGLDIKTSKRNKDNLGHSSSLGVLINKKQA